MYGEYLPALVYGVKEPSGESSADYACLRLHGLQEFALDVVRLYAGAIVYGIRVPLEDVKAGSVSEQVKQQVQDFVDKCSSRFGEPELYLALSGDYSME
ncbi:hypothetical protein ATCC90586_002873 [Pythium insidiosum]|nr:hypothetical protein ATCC90586_002873 [Pythium insidiosum]